MNKRRSIILEGISTSGKTSTFKNICEICKKENITIKLIPEEETIMPLIDSKQLQLNLKYLKSVLENVYKKDADIYLFDRFHFSHTIKTKSTLKDFVEIENELVLQNTKIYFLKISEDLIGERIFNALKLREDWAKYVLRRANNNLNNVLTFYIERQKYLLSLLIESKLSFEIINTDSQNYNNIALTILKNHERD